MKFALTLFFFVFAMAQVVCGETELSETERALWQGHEGGSHGSNYELARKLINADSFMSQMEKKYKKSDHSWGFTNHLEEYGTYIPLSPSEGKMHIACQIKRDTKADLKITLFVVGYPDPESPTFFSWGTPFVRYFVPKGGRAKNSAGRAGPSRHSASLRRRKKGQMGTE